MAIPFAKVFDTDGQQSTIRILYPTKNIAYAELIDPEAQSVIIDCINWPVSIGDNQIILKVENKVGVADLNYSITPVENADGSGAAATADAVTGVVSADGETVLDSDVFRNSTYALVAFEFASPSNNADVSILFRGKNFPKA